MTYKLCPTCEEIEKLQRLRRKPVRTCYSLHRCVVCDEDITIGQSYLDGGYPNRAHVNCAETRLEALKT